MENEVVPKKEKSRILSGDDDDHSEEDPTRGDIDSNNGISLAGCDKGTPEGPSFSLWGSLPQDLKLKEIFGYLGSADATRLKMVDRATWNQVQKEQDTWSLDAIRLSYLNDHVPPESSLISPHHLMKLSKHETTTDSTTSIYDTQSKQRPKMNRFNRIFKMRWPGQDLEFDAEMVLNYLSDKGKCTRAQRIVLEHMLLNHNGQHVSDGDDDTPTFCIAGGSMLSCAVSLDKHRKKMLDFGDLDIFVMEGPAADPSLSDQVVRRVLQDAGEQIEREREEAKAKFEEERSSGSATSKSFDSAQWDYAVLRNSGTLTMVVGDGTRPLQIVLRRISCIEELLCFFDLDCCRFAFDGKTMYTTIEGLRAITLDANYVSIEHVFNPMYGRRAIKYGWRGFDTSFFFLHPLAHLLDEATPVFLKIESFHQPSEVWPSSLRMHVDEGLYTSLAKIPISELRRLDAWKPAYEGDIGAYSNRRADGTMPEVWYEHAEMDLTIEQRHTMSEMQKMLREAGYSESFADHFQLKRQDLFVHIYYDSHLRTKYNIGRCYITGRWFKVTPRMEPNPDYTEDDEDEEEFFWKKPSIPDDRYSFSPEGRKWNDEHASLKRDLTGIVAVVTGGRIKIGFATVLELLRQGATVVATTRFAADAERRYSEEEDFTDFRDRLTIYPLNLQRIDDVTAFVRFVSSKFHRIHVLINNAAQTVRLPLRCYTKLIAIEYEALGKELGVAKSVQPSSALSSLPDTTLLARTESSIGIKLPAANAHLFLPPSELLDTLQARHEELSVEGKRRLQVLRGMFANLHPDDYLDFEDQKCAADPIVAGQNSVSKGSWKLQPTDIHPIELFEAQTINHLAPTMLLNSLVPVLACRRNDTDAGPSYVVNVTSIEGQFSVEVKESQHIHTNMSKAALNMLTKSGAPYYAQQGILVNSVDTGWVSSSIETWKKPPLTERDGAMRVLHPILSESETCGKLYKNYIEIEW